MLDMIDIIGNGKQESYVENETVTEEDLGKSPEISTIPIPDLDKKLNKDIEDNDEEDIEDNNEDDDEDDDEEDEAKPEVERPKKKIRKHKKIRK